MEKLIIKQADRMLKEGDIFRIDKNHEVYIDIPGKFIFSNVTERSPSGNELTRHDVKIGEVFKTTKNIFDTNEYIGWYVVTRAKSEGGGTGHGPHDVYPDGWHISATQLKHKITGWPDAVIGTFEYNDDGKTISFYQSGCFSATIPLGTFYVIHGKKMKKTTTWK